MHINQPIGRVPPSPSFGYDWWIEPGMTMLQCFGEQTGTADDLKLATAPNSSSRATLSGTKTESKSDANRTSDVAVRKPWAETTIAQRAPRFLLALRICTVRRRQDASASECVLERRDIVHVQRHHHVGAYRFRATHREVTTCSVC